MLIRYILVQSLPFMYYFYCNIPLYLLIQIISKYDVWCPKFEMFYCEKLRYLQVIGLIILFVIGIQVLVCYATTNNRLNFTYCYYF